MRVMLGGKDLEGRNFVYQDGAVDINDWINVNIDRLNKMAFWGPVCASMGRSSF